MFLTIVSLAVVAAFCSLVAVQVLPTIRFARCLRRAKPALLPDSSCPSAAVVVCLRGRDANLKQCLEGLVLQDYPNYIIQVVVDHKDDPAWRDVDEVMARDLQRKICVATRQRRYDKCSLKSASQLQAINMIGESAEIVAFIDSDVAPHDSWLREMVARLSLGDVDVATGHRWYFPEHLTPANLIRAVWNSRAVVHAAESAVWGGSFALKTTLLRDSSLLDAWKSALSEDGAICAWTKKHGFQIGFVSTALMVNRQSCEPRNLWGFFIRQLVIGRLYTSQWLGVLLLCLLTAATFVTATVSGCVALVSQQWFTLSLMAAGLIAYLVTTFFQVVISNWTVRQVAKANGEECPRPSLWQLLCMFVVLPLYQVVDIASIIAATFATKTTWREIDYELHGAWSVRMCDYRPFGAVANKTLEANHAPIGAVDAA